MISPELLRRYKFFGEFNEQQLKSLAMIADEVPLEKGTDFLKEGYTAEALYFLLNGSVDLYYTLEEAYHAEERRQVWVSEINPGEPFSISALIKPHVLTATVRASRPCQVIQFYTQGLNKLFKEDPQLEILLLRRVAQAAIERLHATRVLLAAAYS